MTLPTVRQLRHRLQSPDVILRDAVDRFMSDAMHSSRFFSEPFPLATLPWRSMATTDIELLPDIDFSETDKEVSIVANIPGYDPKNVKVEIKDNCLTMQGTMEEQKEEKGRRWHHQERRSGSFYREIMLPSVDDAKAKCAIKNGTLTVTVPKKEEAKGRTLPVEVQS
jgi:HSP20 family protein